ncbi:MAG: acetate/propionate family kinase [Phycisphaerae bacterium]|nr:acetate/propionate family kinase [Phycisphaerae bacterium]
MKILVCNIGSTSFKFRLFRIADGSERELASGGADRIGKAGGQMSLRVGTQPAVKRDQDFPDHGAAIAHVLVQLVAGGALARTDELDAVAFKAVMAGDTEPVVLVDDTLLARMEYFTPVAPAHNPPYIAAMRMFRKVLATTPLVAAFEPGFHRTIPQRRRLFAVPAEWSEKYGIRRYGFHGASHCYIATRTAELMGPAAKRVISCHLGGSSSICAVRDGKSVATSMGLSPQSGLPQSSRAGDFDIFALALLKKQTGMDADAVMTVLGAQGGLAALSGTTGDMRDIRTAAAAGDSSLPLGGGSGRGAGAEPVGAPARDRAKLTLELFATAIRDFVGAYLVELGGADAIVFTGGIGQNDPDLRAEVCAGLDFAGIKLDAARNASAAGEARIEAADSKTALWVMPTNEELIVARQAAMFLKK